MAKKELPRIYGIREEQKEAPSSEPLVPLFKPEVVNVMNNLKE